MAFKVYGVGLEPFRAFSFRWIPLMYESHSQRNHTYFFDDFIISDNIYVGDVSQQFKERV